jgi:hypothetical protein
VILYHLLRLCSFKWDGKIWRMNWEGSGRKVLSQHFPGWTKENHETCHSGYPVPTSIWTGYLTNKSHMHTTMPTCLVKVTGMWKEVSQNLPVWTKKNHTTSHLGYLVPISICARYLLNASQMHYKYANSDGQCNEINDLTFNAKQDKICQITNIFICNYALSVCD